MFRVEGAANVSEGEITVFKQPKDPSPWLNAPPSPMPIPPLLSASLATSSAVDQRVAAQSLEFVAKPGAFVPLRTCILATIRELLGASPNFSGCMILVSEQETRLVTLLTLWSGEDAVEPSDADWEQVKKILSPYVDRWLRHRNHEAFLSTRERCVKNAQP